MTARGRLLDGVRSPHPHRWRPRDLVTRIGTVFQEPQHQFVAATATDELAAALEEMEAEQQQEQKKMGR